MDRETLRFQLNNLVKLHRDLEKQLVEFDEIIPYERQQNAKIFSPRLLNMMLGCGPQIESVTRLIAERCNFTEKRIPGLIHQINQKGVLSHFEITSKLHNLRFGPITKDLEWWKTYNGLKHALTEKQFDINYTVVMDAFASLSALHHFADTILSVPDERLEYALDHKHWLTAMSTPFITRHGNEIKEPIWQSLVFRIEQYFRMH